MLTLKFINNHCTFHYFQNIRKIFESNQIQNFCVVFWHLATIAYAIVSIVSLHYKDKGDSVLPFLAITPGPVIFFLATEPFTRPDLIEQEAITDVM